MYRLPGGCAGPHRRPRGVAQIEGFGQIVDGASGAEPGDVVGHGVRADHHHRDVLGEALGLKPGEQVLAAHVGQVQVQQDQIRAV